MDFEAVWLSVQLAWWTMVTLFVLGLPLAYWLAVTRWRLKFLLEAIVVLPMILPPTVLGFYILIAIGPLSPLGTTYEAMVGRSLAFSFQGLLLASVLYSLPFAVRPFTAAFAGVDRRLIEASWCLGVSRLRTLVRLVLPHSWAGILTCANMSVGHTIGQFGVILMVDGNIPRITPTVSISIYDEVQAVNYSVSPTASFVLSA